MIEQLKIIISAEISKLKKSITDGKRLIDNFGEDAEEVLSEVNDAMQKVGDISKKTLAVMGGAIAGAATALLALAGTTREYREQQAMLKTAFENAGGSAESAKNTYNDLYRVLGDTGQATEAAQHLAKLTTDQRHLSEWTSICQGVYASFGSSLPIESLAEAANETAKTGQLTGALTDAINWSTMTNEQWAEALGGNQEALDAFNYAVGAGKTQEEAFQEALMWCNSESEREKLIRGTLNGLYGDAAAQYEKNNVAVLEQRDAQARLTDAMAVLGEAMEPVMTVLTEFGAEILEKITPHVQDLAENHLETFKEVLNKVADAIGKVITWVVDNWELVSTIAGVIATISAVLTVLSTVMGVVNAVMLASPVTWVVLGIVAAIAALTAGIILCIKYWDEIKAAGSRAVQPIKDAWNNVADWFNAKVVQPIINFFSNMWSKIKGIGGDIKNFFKNLFNFSWNLPKIKVPKFSITPSGWDIGDLLKGKIPKLSVTWNARGGVFDSPTLFNYGGSLQGIGENGAEAVVPLENNTEWLDKIAARLNAKTGNTPVILQVDGKTFAKTAISTINDLTRQRGKLLLNLI